MDYIQKTITAGGLVYVLKHPEKRRAAGTRAPKSSLSRAEQVFLNLRLSWQKLELLLAANIRPGDWVGVMTYDDAHLPGRREDVMSDLSVFKRRLKKLLSEAGVEEPALITNIEQSHSDTVNDGARWHVHFAIASSDSRVRAAICKAWRKGIVLISPFKLDPKTGYEALARYMCKERPEKVGQHTWFRTWRCRKPEVDVQVVPAGEPLTVPPGCRQLARADNESSAGSVSRLKYLTAELC